MSFFKREQPEPVVEAPEDRIWIDPGRAQRLLIMLLLDTSSSMSGTPIKLLNDALSDLAAYLRSDVQLSSIAHVGLITFGHGDVVAWRGRERVSNGTSPFVSAADFQVPQLGAGGVTPMMKAIDLGLSSLAREKQSLRDMGLSYFCPVFWLLSDGVPTGEDGRLDGNWKLMIPKLQQGERAGSFTFFTVSAGDISPQGDEVLRALAPEGHLRLQGFEFSEVLKLVSSSAERLARGDSMANIKRRIFEQIPA